MTSRNLLWVLAFLVSLRPVLADNPPEPALHPEHLSSAASWSGRQFVQADEKGSVFVLRADTLEVYPLGADGTLGSPERLESASAGPSAPPDPVIGAAMTGSGDWTVQQGYRIRLFQGGKEQTVEDPHWIIEGVGLVGDQPVISGAPSGTFAQAFLKGDLPESLPLSLVWQGKEWEPLMYAPTKGVLASGPRGLSERRSLRFLGTSDGHLWTAFAYQHRFREYSAAGRLLTEIVVDRAEVRQVGDAESRLQQAAQAEADLKRQGIDVSIAEYTAQPVAIALAEGRDGRLYFLIHHTSGTAGSGIDLERYDPVGVTLEVLSLPIPDPGMGTMAPGQDGLYIAGFQASTGIWRIPWEQLEGADWKPVQGVEARTAADDLEGAWREKGGRGLVRFAKDRVITWEDGRLTVRGLVSLEGTEASLRRSGFGESWKVARQQNVLRIEREGGIREYTRLVEIPASVSLAPAPLGKPKELAPERIAAIQAELAQRVSRAEEARRSPDENPRRAVDAENVRYLRDLVAEVGWIDARRFGLDGASAAATLAWQGLDIPLLLAAQSFVEKDLKRAPTAAAVYSVFCDTLQVTLGGKQRYGTQIVVPAGSPVVLPLESRAGVDPARKKIGLAPLAESLALASRTLYQGRPVLIAEGEVIEAPKPSAAPAAVASGGAARR